jgi:hypothetical protein
VQEESSQKLSRLKLWMQKKKLPAGLQMLAMEHFNECWTSDALAGNEITEVLDACPPAVRESTPDLHHYVAYNIATAATTAATLLLLLLLLLLAATATHATLLAPEIATTASTDLRCCCWFVWRFNRVAS